jgi:hypothetical protein
MARGMLVGDIRARRDGVIVLRESADRFSVTRPNVKERAVFYRDGGRSWCVDVHDDDKPQLRAFVDTQSDAEEAAAAVILKRPTFLVWYDLSAVLTDNELVGGIAP